MFKIHEIYNINVAEREIKKKKKKCEKIYLTVLC